MDAVYSHGGPWPRWLLAIEGYWSEAPFERDPYRFDDWFEQFRVQQPISIIADYRAEAIRDGADLDPWPGKNAGYPKPSWLKGGAL
jgi:hypothetical protein